ncbi:MAG: hypothetical protein RL386_646 [Bacteroidota bacterium]
MRFGKLKQIIPAISGKVRYNELKELETFELITFLAALFKNNTNECSFLNKFEVKFVSVFQRTPTSVGKDALGVV